MKFLDLHLSSFRFGSLNETLRRDRIGEAHERSETYDARYDFSTLFYDVYYDHLTQEVVVICPALLNFRELVDACRFQIDGIEVPISSIGALSRGNVIRFAGQTETPQNFSFDHALFSGTVGIGARHLDMFAGKNVLFAISKDNKLEWIEDWLKYYSTAHGANGVVIYDNQSTSYSMEELGETLRLVPGIEAAAIVRAWFPFGPGGAGNVNFNSKFLHMTMVELGRQRLLYDARAVLNVDIDEFVYSNCGKTVFDATVESPEGYLRFDGEWVYARPPFLAGYPRHADHTHVRKDGRPKVSRKWSIVPGGPLKDYLWRTHRIKSRRDATTPDFGFWHFRKISNNWDYDRSEVLAEDKMQPSRPLQAAMEAVFFERRDEAAAAPTRLVITSMKNEAPYILEWIAYHRVLGFTDFLVYTNDCEDGTCELLDRLQELGILVHERNKVLRRGPQKSALKAAKTHPLVQRSDWIYVADIDEFLNIKIGDGRLDDLLNHVPEADVIPVTWRLFSNDDLETISDDLVIASFTDGELPIEQGGQPERFTKSLFRKHESVERFGTHVPVLPEGAEGELVWMSPNGREFTNDDTPSRPSGEFGYEVAQVNHYAVKSIDAYLLKKERGRVNHVHHVLGVEYWQKMSKGGEKDVSILRHLEATQAEIDALLDDEDTRSLHDAGLKWHMERAEDLKRQPEFKALRDELIALKSDVRSS